MKYINRITKFFFLLIIAQTVVLLAHGTKHPTRYIAVDGVDSGDCSDASKPCSSVAYAVELSSKGDKVYIASGEYFSSGMDIFYLLSGLVVIEAGFSKADQFSHKDSSKNVTVFYGVPIEHRHKIQAMGFKVVTDAKALDIKISKEEIALLNNFQKMTTSSQTYTACDSGFADQFECNGFAMQSRMPPSALHPDAPALNDIWGFVDLNNNKEYAVVGLKNGTAIVDVTDPAVPVTIAHVQGMSSTWRDLKIYQHWDANNNRYNAFAYVTTEANQGLQIIDLGDLPNSISVSATIDDFVSAHNINIANVDYSSGKLLEGTTPFLYVAGSNRSFGAYRVYDISNPIIPRIVTPAPEGTGYVHDLTTFTIGDDRTSQCAEGHNPCELLVDFNENTVDIWDMTDKALPIMISSTPYENATYTHSGWWSKDKKFIFIQDEIDERSTGSNTVLRTLDISDLRTPFVSNVWTGTTQAIDHNGFAVGDTYYMSNYRRGLTVFDITDPNQPNEIGFFDTYPTPSANSATFAGAWGVYPFLPSGNILISDISYGLFVVTAAKNIGGTPTPTPVPTPEPPPAKSSSGAFGEIILLMLLGLAYARSRYYVLPL